MASATFKKDPDDERPFRFDWSKFLAPTGDSIDTVDVTTEAGLTEGSVSNTTTTVTVWLSGGTADNTYTVACEIVTLAGLTIERTITIEVDHL